jgi:DNA-binding NarL/FixJ family response regulator
MSLRVFLVEDSKLIRERLEEGLSSSEGISIVGTADNEAAALAGLHSR